MFVNADAVLAALAHPVRRRILQLVWDAERPSAEIADAVGLSRPAASQHLRVLRDADLVVVRPHRNRRLYQVRLDTVDDLRYFLEDFWAARMDALKEAAERRAAGRQR